MDAAHLYDATPLWWPPFGPLYDDLSHPMKTSIEDVGRVLQANRQKLLLVLSFFRPPQEETTRLVAGRSSFYLDSDLSRKWSQFEDPELSDLALQASKHLNLDAVQAYFLILHYQQSLAGTSNASRAVNSFISLKELQIFYFQERLHMLKCLELMIQDGEASPFWSVTTAMLDDDLDARVADIIVANLVDSYGHGPCDSSTLKGKQQENSMLGVSKLHGEGVFQRDPAVWLAEATQELCNLLDILLAIWDDPALLCPANIWLKLANSFHQYLFPCDVAQRDELQRTVHRAKDLASLILVQGLHLEDILQQMYSPDTAVEGGALFGSRSPRAGEDQAPAAAGPSNNKRARRSPVTVASRHQDRGADDSVLAVVDGSKTVFSKEERDEITQILESWCKQSSVHLLEVPTLLGWAAFLCLHDTVSFDIYADPVQTWAHVELFAANAWASGGFAAVLHLAKAEGLRVDYNLASVYKSIQINLVIASLATFGISPLTLSPDDLDIMLQTTYHLFNDQPDLCSMFWDVNALVKEPMFHFLNVARDIFPAVPMPLLYMLAGVCNGPQNATQVHTYLARLPSLTFRHYEGDPDIQFDGTTLGANVLATASKPIKEIPMLSIPQGTGGNIVHRLTEHELHEERHTTKLLRKLTSTPTPKSVHRTVSLAGFARNSPLGAGSRGSEGMAESAGLEAIKLEFHDPGARSNHRTGEQADNTVSPPSPEERTHDTPGRDANLSSPFAAMADSSAKPTQVQQLSPLKPLRTLSILTDVDEEQHDNTALLIKWNVEPPRGSGMVKVLLEVGAVSASLRRGTHSDAVVGDLKVLLRLLSNMAKADSSTGKELLKYEVWDIESNLHSKSRTDEQSGVPNKGRVTLLSLICRLLDNLLHLKEPSLDAMGLCLSICASLATHAPGEVVAQLMSTDLFNTSREVPLFIDTDALETSVGIKSRMEESTKSGLPRFQLLHKEHECRIHVYPVTEGLLEVLAACLHKGVTTGMIAEATGWILVHTLGKHREWTYANPAQKHHLAELCIRTIRRGLQCVTSAARHARSNEEVDHRISFVAALEGLMAGPLMQVLPSAFPPPAVVLEEGRVSSSNLVVIKSTENLAKEMLALIPAMDLSQEVLEHLFFRAGESMPGAACLSSYLTYSHSDLKMRLLALQAIKVFLEVISGQKARSAPVLSYKDLLVEDGARGLEGNHALWRNTLVQSTGLVMAGIDTQVCCAALECVKWTLANHWPLMHSLLFPTLLDNKTESSIAPIIPWARKPPRVGQPSTPGAYSTPSEWIVGDGPGPSSAAQELMPLGKSVLAAGDGKPTSSGPNRKQQMSTSTLSVLDCIWDILQDATRLLKEKPQPVAAALQLVAALIQSSHLSPKHKEAADTLKGQTGFWHCISACVPSRSAPESDHEPERSQYLAEQAALLSMAVELSGFRKNPANYSRSNVKDLLAIVKEWEREGWRGRSSRINQLLMEREGTTIQEMQAPAPTSLLTRGMCNPSRSCICLGLIILVLIIIVVFQRRSL